MILWEKIIEDIKQFQANEDLQTKEKLDEIFVEAKEAENKKLEIE